MNHKITNTSKIIVVDAGEPPCPEGGLFGPRRSVRVPHDHLHRRVVLPRAAVPIHITPLGTSLYTDRASGLPGPDLLEQMEILIERS